MIIAKIDVNAAGIVLESHKDKSKCGPLRL